MKFPTRNIGQIIESTLPLTDAGLHLLDGSLIDGSGIYADFVTYISGFVNTYPDLFETEANWQSTVTTYGVCGKFVYDSVNNTVRLPKITGIVEGTTDLTALGDLVEAGLPNITGSLLGYCGPSTQTASGTFSYSQASSFSADNWGSGGSRVGNVTLNASRSSSIYGNSTTVQPQTIKVLYYIVIATSTKTDIQVNINKVAADLNNKVDIDLANVNTTGKIQIAHNAMPSNRYIDLAFAHGGSYTAPADGYVILRGYGGSSGTTLTLSNETVGGLASGFCTVNQTAGSECNVFIPVKKGDNFHAYQYNGTVTLLRFIYAQGCTS